jgi:hypothetical protein
MDKLTFKQYVESRNQLLKAIENVPVTIIEYEVRKYCTLTLGECAEESVVFNLKPKQKLQVRWMCQNPLLPIPESIKVLNTDVLVEAEEHPTFWNSDKLQKWLIRHTHEGVNYGHKI